MHIAVYENNLLWSVKLRNAAIQLGHTCDQKLMTKNSKIYLLLV